MSAMNIDASAIPTFVGENPEQRVCDPERTSIPIMFARKHLKRVQKFRTIISESKRLKFFVTAWSKSAYKHIL